MKTKNILFAIMALIVLGSCASSKKVTNFQDINYALQQIEAVKYDTKIKCDDELSILVSCADMSLAQQYNLNVTTGYSGASTSDYTSQIGTKTSDANYRVDDNGKINFPVLGEIKVEGMTRMELVDYLTTEIKKDIKDPVVTVNVTNFNITIVGDVAQPGNYTFNTEKVNILQALAEAGDLTLTAKRDDIMLIRKVNGLQTYTQLDMTSKDVLESEDFYLQQNDILYVKTDVARERKSDARMIWSTSISSLSSILSITTIILAVMGIVTIA